MVIRQHIIRAVALLSMASFVLMQAAIAQDFGAANVYRTQFLELHAKVKAILAKGERQARMHPQDELQLREEILALAKLAHRLGEEAARSNLDVLKRGRDSNKRLLLVAQGCEAISFVSMALDHFLETGDRAFLGLARGGDNSGRGETVVTDGGL